jgi:biotin carboxylase
LIVPTGSYRATDFFEAAESLGVEVAVAAEQPLPLVEPELYLEIDCEDPDGAAEQIVELALRTPIDAIVPIDDAGVVIAAIAAERLGLPHNSPDAARATRDKALMRKKLSAAEVNQPRWRRTTAARPEAEDLSFPLVAKPLSLAGSRGVIKVESIEGLEDIAARIAGITGEDDLLLEEFAAGPEVAVEGLLFGGELDVLAIFDKPDPLDGPYFEETIYVTPSRLSKGEQKEITRMTAEAVSALGLSEGPIHAELRVSAPDDVKVIEVAGRSIGGICGRSLSFGLLDTPLESLILRHALGRRGGTMRRGHATGVMMIPIPESGVLEEVHGADGARDIAGVESVEISTPLGTKLATVPDADRYLGFIFAKGPRPEDVEESLRAAHARLKFVIRG